jgi:hypothetical protein
MKSKTAIQKVQAEAVQIVRDRTEEQTQEQRSNLFWQMIGGVKVADAVSNQLSSQLLRTLERIQKEKLYLEAGYKTFDQFLDKAPESPMSHDAYRLRVNLLQAEGDELFDSFNSIGLSLSKRKLLGKGSVEVDGEEIVVRDDKDELRIPLNNRTELLSAISRLADKNNEKSRTIERGKKELERKDKKLQEALAPKQSSDELTPFVAARVTVLTALDGLIRATRALGSVERAERRTETLTLLDPLWTRLHEAFGLQSEQTAHKGNALTDLISEADMNDLADALEN